MTDTEIIQRAIDRARGHAASVHFTGVVCGRSDYHVDSSDDTHNYLVTVVGPEYRCTCPGGNHPCCWHRAAVASLRLSRLAHGLPADGPSAEDAARSPSVADAEKAIARAETMLGQGLEDLRAKEHADVPGYAASLATVRALFDR